MFAILVQWHMKPCIYAKAPEALCMWQNIEVPGGTGAIDVAQINLAHAHHEWVCTNH